MTERFRFFDALTYGIRTLFWRPVRAVAYIAALSLLYAAYYKWAQSAAGIGFFTGYMQSTAAMAQGDFGTYGGYFAALMAGSAIFGSVMIAGAYRVYVRDESAMRLPIQLGLDELRMLGICILVALIGTALMILAMIALVVLGIVVGFIATQMGMNLGSNGSAQDPAFAMIIGLVVMIPILLLEFYIFGRLSVGFALAIRDRKFRLGGVKASNGAGLQLLWAHLVLYLVMMCTGFALSPGTMAMLSAAMTDPMAMQDPALMAEMTARPYGNMAWLAIPVISAMNFLLFGPTAAVANWDARKRAAAEAAEAPVPAPAPAPAPDVEPAPGVGTGETAP
jgi:hypothetical protein